MTFHKHIFVFVQLALLALLLTFFTPSQATAADFCALERVDHNTNHDAIVLAEAQKSDIRLNRGANQFWLSCNLSRGGVFSFQRHGLNSYSWQQAGLVKQPLPSSDVTFIIDQGESSALIALNSKFDYNPRFQWQTTVDFMLSSQKHNLIIGLFYGLSFTLMLYVFILNLKVKDKALTLYSVYIFCITGFILLQEGQLYLYLPSTLLPQIHTVYLMSIGLTVVSATWFMCEILKINTNFPRTSQLFKFTSLLVLLACVCRLVVNENPWLAVCSIMMGYGTLILVAAIFFTALLQVFRRVDEASLVFSALSIVLFSMVFRIVLLDSIPFVQRYGFIIAFAVESFMLAIAVSRRIGRIAVAKERAENDANMDILCNILNRRGFTLKAQQLISMQRQSDALLAVFYVDMDKFKQLNDTYGHNAGDAALKTVASYLSKKMRMTDAVARIGGDEFVTLASFKNQAEITAKLAELQNHFQQFTIELNGKSILASASLGYAVFSTPPDTLDTVLAAGDAAMYQAKLQRKSQASAEVNNLE